MPSRPEPITSNHRPWAPSPDAINLTAATRDSTARAIFTAWRSRLCIQAGVDNQPWSLAMATIEPVKVIAPTNTDTTIDTTATRSEPPASGNSATPRATSSEDMPPQPLNRATVSGMEVIGTRCAVMAPRIPPARVPAMIQIQAVAAMPPSPA